MQVTFIARKQIQHFLEFLLYTHLDYNYKVFALDYFVLDSQEASGVCSIIFVQQVFSGDYTFKEPYPPSSNGQETVDDPAGVSLVYI